MSTKNLTIIGSNALVSVAGIDGVPAKIDTGADSSSIWASDVFVNSDNYLEFCLFGPESPFYTGEHLIIKDFGVQRVRSSIGEVTIRYRVSLPIVAAGRKVRVKVTIYHRSRNNFPIVIGRKTLKNRFLVDVAHTETERPPKMDNTDIEAELAENPQQFHTKLYRLHNQ